MKVLCILNFKLLIILVSLWSDSFTSSKLHTSMFIDSFYINSADLVDCFEYSLSTHTCSFENDSNTLKTIVLRFSKNTLCQYFCSIGSTFFRSFEILRSCSTTQYSISCRSSKIDKCIITSRKDMQYSERDLNILLFLCNWFTCHW